MGKKEELLKELEDKASEKDIALIDKKLSGMNKGKVKEAWKSVEALYQMIKDPDAAWTSKALAIGSLVYLISPIDAIPDVIPVAGLSDDLAVIAGTVATLGVQLRKYMLEYQQEKAIIDERIIDNLENKKFEMQRDLELEKQKMKEKFIIKLVIVIGIFITAIVAIIKFL